METPKTVSGNNPVFMVTIKHDDYTRLSAEDKARYMYDLQFDEYNLREDTYSQPQPELPGIEATLAERGAQYGVFAEHAAIAQNIQTAMHNSPNWQYAPADVKQALTVIADKIARVLNGDLLYADNWHDIVGYAKLVEDRITKDVDALRE